jgi:serine/threonine protein kinase
VEDKTIIQPQPIGSIRPGVRLNGVYEIERLIAEGGMGEVYKGFNIQTEDPVAIKVIRTDLARNPDVFALFRREASTLNNLHHDAVVRYYVFSVDPGLQRAYLAMEYVDGPSLTQRIATARLSPGELDVFRMRIGSALQAAHRLGIVHRDVSPDNFILPDGAVERAKIIDFGIARWRRPGEATIIGDGFAGKYNYVSPEQLGLYDGEVTAKSDIYSFGLVLTEACLGRRIDMEGTQIQVIEKRRRVPDLSGSPPSIRPLLQWMLQPDPADRPPDMAAVLSWRPTRPSTGPDAGGPAPAVSGGHIAAILGGLIVIASLAATGFVFRDDLKAALHSMTGPPEPTKTTSSESSSSQSLVPPPPGSVATATASSTSGQVATNTTVPTSEQLEDELPPVAPQAHVDLPSATAGSPYRAEIPAFKDPGGKGLRFAADPAPPAGLSLTAHGDGSSDISGVPAKAGSTTFEIVATNHKGRQGRMTARIVVAAAPTETSSHSVKTLRATQRSVDLGSATVGADFIADLPPFDPGEDSRGLALRAEPDPPEGLTFTDESGGLGRLSGKPTRPGAYSFEIVATDLSGRSDRMTVKMVVASAKLSPTDVSGAFLRAFDGGPCFLARANASGDGAATIEAIGDDMTVFQRFEAEYSKFVGNALTANYKAISPPQCPALEAFRATTSGDMGVPRIELAHFAVGGGTPLAGTVSGIGGRRLVLLIVGEDGTAFRLKTTPGASADIASFLENVGQVDDSSIGPLEMLIAIVSVKPLASLDVFRKGSIHDLAPKLAAEWRDAGAVARIELFQFKK